MSGKTSQVSPIPNLKKTMFSGWKVVGVMGWEEVSGVCPIVSYCVLGGIRLVPRPPPRDPGQPKSRAYPHPSKNTETNTNDDSESVIIKAFGLSGFCSVLVENGLHEDPES